VRLKIPYSPFNVKMGINYKLIKITRSCVKEDCLATCTFCPMGYKNVKSMVGGWKAWKKTGYSLRNVYIVKGGSLRVSP